MYEKASCASCALMILVGIRYYVGSCSDMLPSAVCVGVSLMVSTVRYVDAMTDSDTFAASPSAV